MRSEPIDQAQHAPADSPPRLDDLDLIPNTAQFVGAGQATQASPDHDDSPSGSRRPRQARTFAQQTDRSHRQRLLDSRSAFANRGGIRAPFPKAVAAHRLS
ncbi:MAG: hypothetical protein ACK56I_17970, partial [bacterium]